MRNRTVPLAVVIALIVLGLAGCGTSGSTMTGTSTVAASGSSSTSARSANSGTPAPRCLTSQLDVNLATNGAAGSIALYFTFTNHSSATCSLYGYPGLGLLDQAGNPLPTHVLRTRSTVIPAVAERRVTLAPAGRAHAYGSYSDVAPTACPKASALEVTPPNAYGHLTTHTTLTPCGGIIHISPVFH
jgi:hypothetical protein